MEKSSLTALARQQLTIARQASSGRSAKTVYGGHEHVLRARDAVAGRVVEGPGEDVPGQAVAPLGQRGRELAS